MLNKEQEAILARQPIELWDNAPDFHGLKGELDTDMFELHQALESQCRRLELHALELLGAIADRWNRKAEQAEDERITSWAADSWTAECRAKFVVGIFDSDEWNFEILCDSYYNTHKDFALSDKVIAWEIDWPRVQYIPIYKGKRPPHYKTKITLKSAIADLYSDGQGWLPTES